MVIAIALQLDAVVSHEMYRNHWEMDDHRDKSLCYTETETIIEIVCETRLISMPFSGCPLLIGIAISEL